MPSLRELIMEHPITSACTALGAGIGVGVILSSLRGSSGGRDSELLDAALAPLVSAIREQVDQGTSAEEAIRGALRSQMVPSRERALTQLVRLLMPLAVGMGIRALNKSLNSGAAEPDN